MLGAGGVSFVLHLEHDRETFLPVDIVTKYEVSLRAGGNIIILFEIGIGKLPHAAGHVERVLAMLLQSLSQHFGRQSALQVLVMLELLILRFYHC